MLVLITGITGSLGRRLAAVAIERGLSVRGLGRDPAKLDAGLLNSLESFITTQNYYDIAALDQAVTGVDAVICAYTPAPLLDLDAQLLLLRAAERASVKTFIASSWNNDWTNINFGEYEHYDAHIAFERQAAITSPIRPVYIFTGYFADILFTPYGPGGFDTTGETPTMCYWGNGNKQLHSWTTQDDAAVWTIEILINGKGVREGKGGFFRMRSGEHTIEELAVVYEETTGTYVDVRRQGSLIDLADEVASLRRGKGRARYFEYLPQTSALIADWGRWQMNDVLDFDHVRKSTSLEQHLKERLGLP
ncbi:nad dependent epimerase [Colletotrichum truncatum]|uniref:Nad dependent epimerase n=1 Tax=Colletotrichum truncatum TaxID=5467 RepID=A0ACC3ZL63_COLTU|nr:nad dependent epimerase [Colletotrichum truncatum]KAF6800053.1 nad dependent epimerase [Colletotrichum truncatum]